MRILPVACPTLPTAGDILPGAAPSGPVPGVLPVVRPVTFTELLSGSPLPLDAGVLPTYAADTEASVPSIRPRSHISGTTVYSLPGAYPVLDPSNGVLSGAAAFQALLWLPGSGLSGSLSQACLAALASWVALAATAGRGPEKWSGMESRRGPSGD